ncbi:MAG: flagellar biosynthesis anti-sigma factor FlgM [Lachnospiraceae bacterium]|nr:flagellar biosynthesis anti-sigma factor FlgM [Lachnospiraceae bacterium]
MRIDPFNKVTQLYQASKPKKANATEKASFSDKLELSRAGKDLQVAKSAVASASDVREDKVAQIKAQMEAGTYSVSARDIAEKLVNRF